MDVKQFNHGFPESDWQKTKSEALNILRKQALQSSNPTITYSDLTKAITAISLDPHGTHLTHLLDEISRDEHAAGRGMLTALVVLKETGSPGPGFFKLAKQLGYKFSDELAFWLSELKRVTGQQ